VKSDLSTILQPAVHAVPNEGAGQITPGIGSCSASRAAYRIKYSPSDRGDLLGFRVAAVPQE
jgi:hypothetical protein